MHSSDTTGVELSTHNLFLQCHLSGVLLFLWKTICFGGCWAKRVHQQDDLRISLKETLDKREDSFPSNKTQASLGSVAQEF